MNHIMMKWGLVGVFLSPLGCSVQADTVEKGGEAMQANSHRETSDSGHTSSKINGRRELVVNVDVGNIRVRFAPMEKDYRLEWRKGGSCDRIEIDESRSGLDIQHVDDDQSCGGTRVDLVIRDDLSTRISSGAGSITVADTSKLLPHVRSISAQVMAGSIHSEVPSIDVQRQWSQVYAHYDSDRSHGIDVDITLSAGSVKFTR